MYQLMFMCFALLTDWSFAQKTAGDSCVNEYTQIEGWCTILEECVAARVDFQQYGVQPTPCGTSDTLVCCRETPPIPKTTTPAAQVLSASSSPNGLVDSNREPGFISNEKCQEYTKLVTATVVGTSLSLHPIKRVISGAKCKYYGTQLIIGGVKATQGEFPHMAAIGWKIQDGSYKFECGGTLISKRFVLTAGHCTRLPEADKSEPEVVRLGDQNLDPEAVDGAHPIQIPIKRIHKHPDYKYTKTYNDIALLELESDVQFNDYIRPACLWTNKDLGNHEKAVATGWGIVNSTTNQKSDELLKVSLSILNNTECNDTLSGIINRRWSHGFDETQICAGDTRQIRDSCQGDSGSPLQVVSDENKCIYKVLGITSFGAKFCGYAPAVYTKVSSYVGWIESIVWPPK